MGSIPCDDIMDYYSEASESLKFGISDLLQMGDMDRYMITVLHRRGTDAVITSACECSAPESVLMLSSLIESFKKNYGTVWLLELLKLVKP